MYDIVNGNLSYFRNNLQSVVIINLYTNKQNFCSYPAFPYHISRKLSKLGI